MDREHLELDDEERVGELPSAFPAEEGDQSDAFPERRTSRKTESCYSYLPSDDNDHFSSKPNSHARASWWRRTLLDSWVPEVLALATSTACLVAILIVLRIFDNQAAPTLPYGITLNAAIATLATASRLMLIYTVTAAISQLKWCWYLKTRKIKDMQVFDDASRGPWGSMTLLISLRARPVASIGALVTILALAFDPFVQLILTYPTRMVDFYWS